MNRLLQAAGAALVAGPRLGVVIGLKAAKPAPLPANPARDPALEKLGHEKLYESMLATAAGAIDRARSSAQFIETAAAAVICVYTAVLGTVFVVGDNPLPLRGLVPAIFLSALVVFAAFYLAFLKRGRDVVMANVDVMPDSARRLQAQVSGFVEWISASVSNRQAFLRRAAVVSLAHGLTASSGLLTHFLTHWVLIFGGRRRSVVACSQLSPPAN